MKILPIVEALLVTLLTGTCQAQTPAIQGAANNYSFILPGVPDCGIAQGSIFAIFGTNLANTTTPLQSALLQTSLSGVSVAITVNNTNRQALLHYVTPTQIAAILPSSAPAGTGQVSQRGQSGRHDYIVGNGRRACAGR